MSEKYKNLMGMMEKGGGAPENPEDSVFLSIPDLAKAANLAVAFKNENSDGRKKSLDTTGANLLANPDHLTQFLDALEILKEVKSYDITRFEAELERALERAKFKEFPPKTEVLQKLLTIYSESAVYAGLVEKILRKLVEKCKNTKSIVDLLYQIALAGYGSNNKKLIKKTLEIFSFQTGIFNKDAEQVYLFLLGQCSQDDNVFKKNHEILSACGYFGGGEPELDKQRRQAHSETFKKYSKELNEYLDEFEKRNPKKFHLAMAFFKKIESLAKASGKAKAGLVHFEKEGDQNEYPYNLIHLHGELGKLIDERLSIEGIETGKGLQVRLSLPRVIGQMEGLDQASDVIKKALLQEPVGPRKLDDDYVNNAFPGQLIEGRSFVEAFWQTLARLVPEGYNEENKIGQIEILNDEMVNDINQNTKYLLSPRGDLVEITDKTLEDLGFKSILFEMDKTNKRDTVVCIEVGHYFFEALLDEHLTLRRLTDNHPILLPKQGEFGLMELLVGLESLSAGQNF
ncbi:MAG: hypothetical protein AAB348_01505, partial [Patescibacteria group bacterium]